MIIPVRCFTCGKVLADKYDYYVEAVESLKHTQQTTGGAPGKKVAKKKETSQPQPVPVADDTPKYFDKLHTGPIMDKLGLSRYCCRRHLLGAVDMMEVI